MKQRNIRSVGTVWYPQWNMRQHCVLVLFREQYAEAILIGLIIHQTNFSKRIDKRIDARLLGVLFCQCVLLRLYVAHIPVLLALSVWNARENYLNYDGSFDESSIINVPNMTHVVIVQNCTHRWMSTPECGEYWVITNCWQ